LDEIDKLIRWTLVDEVAGEEPSPQVWQNIQAKIAARSQAMPSPPGMRRPWRQLASALRVWASDIIAPLNTSWDLRLTPQERSYLIWRESLSLAMIPITAMLIY